MSLPKICTCQTTPSKGCPHHGHDANRVTSADMLRASEVCAHAAKDPLNRGEIASILQAASRILANTSLRPALANAEVQRGPASDSHTHAVAKIEAWKKAAEGWNCSTPEELTARINQLPETY